MDPTLDTSFAVAKTPLAKREEEKREPFAGGTNRNIKAKKDESKLRRFAVRSNKKR